MRPHENAFHTGRKLLQEMRSEEMGSSLACPNVRERVPHHHLPPGDELLIPPLCELHSRGSDRRKVSVTGSWNDIYTAPGINTAMSVYYIKSATIGDTICLLLPILVINKIGLAVKFSINDSVHRARISAGLLSENERQKMKKRRIGETASPKTQTLLDSPSYCIFPHER